MSEALRRRKRLGISPPASKKPKLAHPVQDQIKPTEPPTRTTLRVYSWNINGILPFIQPTLTSYFTASTSDNEHVAQSTHASLRTFLRRQDWPQILQLQEVKISPSDERTKRAVEKAVNLCKTKADEGPQYAVRFCLPTDKYNATGFGRKVYGVATIIRHDFYQEEVDKIRTLDWDTEGRVLIVETKSKLSIWNIYAVNGTTNPYRDSITGDVVGTRHDRKLAFHEHMLHECKRLEADGYRLVLAGDMNVARAPIDGYPNLRTHPEQHVRNRFDFNMKYFESKDGLRAIDSFRHLHPHDRKYTWLARGEWLASCDRVDLIILSRSLVEDQQDVLVAADILMSPADRGPSDHCPLFVTLDLSALANDDEAQT